MKKSKVDFSFNLTISDIENVDFINLLKDKLSDRTLAERFIVEIVESEDIRDYDIVKDFTKEMKDLGVRIAIDDFGSGFSNYQHILEIEPDYLKIDGSFIKDIHVNPKSFKLVKSISSFAESMNIKTIAEFVSNKEIFSKTKELDIDQYQGFYFSEPLLGEYVV